MLIVACALVLASASSGNGAAPARHRHHPVARRVCGTVKAPGKPGRGRQRKHRRRRVRVCVRLLPMHKATLTIHTQSGGFTPPSKPSTSDDEAQAPRLPVGPYRPPARPSGPVSSPAVAKQGATGPRAHPAAGGISVVSSKLLSAPANKIAQESSVAGSGRVVFYTYNWGAAYSTDGGQTFAALDPNTIFPQVPNPANGAGGGYCCDQVAIYDRAMQRFIWALQYPTNTSGWDLIRIAWTSPSLLARYGKHAWSYLDVRSDAVIGDTKSVLDQPRLGLSHRYLYMNANEANSTGAHKTVIVRWPRAGFASPQGPGGYGWAALDTPSLRVSQHVSSSAEMFVGHHGTSTLEVASVDDASNQVSIQDIAEPTVADQNWTLTTPGGDNMLGRQACSQGTQVTGVTQDGDGKLWAAWAEGRDIYQSGKRDACKDGVVVPGNGKVSHFLPQPHVAVAVLSPAGKVDGNPAFKLDSRTAYYNPQFAVTLPELATTGSGEVAFSAVWGGGSYYSNHAVGFLTGGWVWAGDATAHSDPTQSGNPQGDYETVRESGQGYTNCLLSASDINNPTATGYPVFTIFSRPGVNCRTRYPIAPPPGTIAPPPNPSSSLTLVCPQGGTTGAPITLTGQLTLTGQSTGAQSGQPITITVYGPPSGSSIATLAAQTDANGNYSIGYTPSQAGQYAFYASWPGLGGYAMAIAECGVPVSAASTPTSLTLSCPASVNQDTTFPVSGTLSPAIGMAPITLTYTPSASGSPAATHTVSTGTSGNFTDTAPGEPPGTVTIQAHYPGSSTYGSSDASCTVTVQQVIQ